MSTAISRKEAALQTRRASFKPETKQIGLSEVLHKRAIGLGMSLDTYHSSADKKKGLGALIDLIRDAKNCPLWNLPVIEQVRWTMSGPQTDESIKKNFGAKIDLFGSGESPVGIDFVETTMAQPGQLQTNMIACAIGFQIEPEPLCFNASGNAWTHPTTGQDQPISPDVFTENDRFNGALGAAFAGQEPSQFMLPAVLEWGWWANYAAWHMVRGYNLRWKMGQHTNIMDEVLRHTAYMPPNAQEGSASSSTVDIVAFVRSLNDRYESLGSALDFLKINRIRLGSMTVGGVNVGDFRPSRDEERVGATYGGMDLRSLLRGNSEFRKLSVPYVIQAGVPIGLFAQECDTVQADRMRQYLSITQGLGGPIPPSLTDAQNILAQPDNPGGSPAGLERTFDAVAVNVSQRVDAERVIYKGGDLKITVPVLGFEVDGDWYRLLQNDADARAIVMSETNAQFAKLS